MGDKITQMGQELNTLIRTWERYFSGDIRVPPLKEKLNLSRKLRRFTESPPRNSMDRFRSEQLQHRFMAYSANWERLLREKEEGISRGRPLKAIKNPSAESAAPAPNTMKPAPVQQTEDLYSRWVRAKEDLGQPAGMTREIFEAKIVKQRKQLESKLGCAVSFDVKIDGEKVKLTARKRPFPPNGA